MSSPVTVAAPQNIASRLFGMVERSHALAVAVLLLVGLALFIPGFTGLPPMDRDEPRFAQATKQMLESRDFVDIRFQTEARHKKPVGIYWMQAAVVSAAEALGVPEARTTIWLYRIPSLLGALGAILMTYAAAASLTTRRAAFIAGVLMASTILLGVEARLAKTDAVVAFTSTAAMAVLARVWMRRHDPDFRLGAPFVILFWAALGVGILVKGPIVPAIPALAALVLATSERWLSWLGRLKPLPGLAIVLLLIAPWFTAIMIKSGGSFFAEAVGQDMLAKVGSGQEAHGAPPGTYLVAFLGTAWPLAPFLLLALPFAWRSRRQPAVLFCLAWAIPMWLIFEAVPTKLPHYVLPLYPALAILVALAAEHQKLALQGLAPRLIMGWLPLLAVILLLAVGIGLVWFENVFPVLAVGLLLLAVGAAALSWRAIFGGRAGTAAVAATLASVGVAWGVYAGAVPKISIVAISPRLAAAAATAGCEPAGFVTAGYREPSLVFLTRTDLVMTDGAGAAAFLREQPCRIAFVEKRQEQAFIAATIEASVAPRLLSRVEGVNLNGGRRLDIGVYLSQ